jgi:hypothetical protein
MSGGEPLWRRVAGLYLSGIPADAAERASAHASSAATATVDDDAGDPAQQIVLLGEALDLVTLAQGYESPAVPHLLRALIRSTRELGMARAAAQTAEAVAAESGPEAAAPVEAPVEAAVATPETPTAEPAPEAEPETPAEETPSVAEDGPAERADDTAALEKRIAESDRKLTALTAAVGQLVDVLQRRVRDGGSVDRRAGPRLSGQNAKIFIHDHPYEVLNWSKGGFQIRISEGDRIGRGVFDFHFVLDLPDEMIQFQGRARPVRIERTALAAEFATLDAAAAEKIGAIAERLAGES